MCNICEGQVKEQGIRQEDLALLTFTKKKWICMYPGCTKGPIVRDYGNDPFYFDPRKRSHDDKRGSWRGGWFDASEHFLLCGDHKKDWDITVASMQHLFSPEFFLSKVIPFGTKKTNK